MLQTRCSLCYSTKTLSIFKIKERSYFECQQCDLLFTIPTCLLSKEEEKLRYKLHQNDPNDSGYIAHLNYLTNQLIPLLNKKAYGLDFGCGHTPVLATLLQEDGFQIDNYDPIFGPELSKPCNQYDFITCCETVEHFHDPAKQFTLMHSLIKQEGLIAIMTNLRNNQARSQSWWYLRDPTHCSFYSSKTLEFICHLLPWRLILNLHNVAIYSSS